MSTQHTDEMQVDAKPIYGIPLWRNRDFLLLWSGQLISSIGTQVSQLAFPLLVLAITFSPAQAGIVGALRGLPFAVLCLPAGALVDRWDRRKVMLFCDTGRAMIEMCHVELYIRVAPTRAAELV
jgi:hypothetical protein